MKRLMLQIVIKIVVADRCLEMDTNIIWGVSSLGKI